MESGGDIAPRSHNNRLFDLVHLSIHGIDVDFVRFLICIDDLDFVDDAAIVLPHVTSTAFPGFACSAVLIASAMLTLA